MHYIVCTLDNILLRPRLDRHEVLFNLTKLNAYSSEAIECGKTETNLATWKNQGNIKLQWSGTFI